MTTIHARHLQLTKKDKYS